MKINQPLCLQTPFLQPDLLTVSSFISYCRDNGVMTDEEELEYFNKEQLLIPAVRVLMGVQAYKKVFADFDGKYSWTYIWEEDLRAFRREHKVKKVSPKTYYGRGSLNMSFAGLGKIKGFHFGNDGWMDWYIEHKMVAYPVKDGYIPWKRFREPLPKTGEVFLDDWKPLEEVSELMYAKHQMYLLKFIQNRRTLSIKNEGLFRSPESWSQAGRSITKIYSEGESNELIRQYLSEWNRFFEFFIEVRKLSLEKKHRIQAAYDKGVQQKSSYETDEAGEKFAIEDARQESELYDDEIRKTAKAIASKFNLSVTDIEDWRYKILGHGSFGTSNRSRMLRAYVNKLDNLVLNNTEEAYRFVNQLSWFVELLGGTSITAKQLILNSMGETCRYCGKHFEPTRITQVTCGKPKCKQQQRNDHKKESRRLERARRHS